MIETTILTRLQKMTRRHKQAVLDYVEFLAAQEGAGGNGGSAVAGVPLPYVSQTREALQEEEARFAALLPELIGRYEGRYIALYQGKVIDHDPDPEALVVRLDQAWPEATVLVKMVSGQAEPVIRMRSPRFVNQT